MSVTTLRLTQSDHFSFSWKEELYDCVRLTICHFTVFQGYLYLLRLSISLNLSVHLLLYHVMFNLSSLPAHSFFKCFSPDLSILFSLHLPESIPVVVILY